jgi:hypothetical protein
VFLTANETFLNGSVQQISRPGFTGAVIEESDMRPSSLYQSLTSFPSLTTLVGTLPTRQLLSFWGAIFCMFAMVGFSMDLLEKGREPIVLLAMNVVSSGAFLTLIVRLSLPVRKGRLAVAIVGYLVFALVVNRAFPLLPDAPPGRLTLDAIGIIATMTVGYTMFLHFINSTAARYLRAQAEIAVARDIHRVLVPAVDCRIGTYEFLDARTPVVTSAATWWTW